MDGERVGNVNGQHNEAYNAWANMDEGSSGQHDKESPDQANNAENGDSEDELTPEQIEWREGHTDEEMDALANKLSNWLNGFGSSLGPEHGDILLDDLPNSNSKEFGWKYSDFKEFVDNAFEIDVTLSDRNSQNVGGKLSSSLSTLKQAMGEDSPEYKAAAKRIFIDIHDGKYIGSRLSYDDAEHSHIIFGDDEKGIENDDKKRAREKQIREEALGIEKNKQPEKNWKEAINTPEGEARYQKNLNSMDERMKQYIFHLPLNLDSVLGEFISEGENRELRKAVIDKLNENIYSGRLNSAYLGKGKDLHIDKTEADEYREWDMVDSSRKALEELSTDKPKPRRTGNAYYDNWNTMDERTQQYILSVRFNLGGLINDRALAEKFGTKITQAITDGKLNGAYLDNDGVLRIRETADEYRNYDAGKKPIATIEPNETIKKPVATQGEKSPEDFGFRDW